MLLCANNVVNSADRFFASAPSLLGVSCRFKSALLRELRVEGRAGKGGAGKSIKSIGLAHRMSREWWWFCVIVERGNSETEISHKLCLDGRFLAKLG